MPLIQILSDFTSWIFSSLPYASTSCVGRRCLLSICHRWSCLCECVFVCMCVCPAVWSVSNVLLSPWSGLKDKINQKAIELLERKTSSVHNVRCCHGNAQYKFSTLMAAISLQAFLNSFQENAHKWKIMRISLWHHASINAFTLVLQC